MGYFPNGDAGIYYEAKYCEKCIHYGDPPDDGGCPVWLMHLLWNYDQTDNQEIADMLSLFIPRSEDGLDNKQCTMFVEKPNV